jgi:E3 ubiquitin-protein ligase HERC2
LNLHPIFYKKILNKEIDFSEIESLDKLSYKLISNLENIKTEEEFNILNEDLYFAVHSSGDNSLVELVENGQYKKVTFDNLSEFINLYKKFLLTEYDNQISYIRSGIFDILMKDSKKNLSYLLEPEDLEEFITGTPILDMQLLREKTQSDSYESNSKVMINFWRALESFTDEERSLYLKFVCGRTRLPKTRNFNFIHYIKKLNQRNPDKYLPTSTTCYFTLNLPEYSTYEILRDKLRYVIHNCSSIDADFVPEEGADQFDEQFE